MSKNKIKKKKEFSKTLLTQTKWLFISQIILAIVFAYLGYDTSVLYLTTSLSGGVFGATIVFYLNKAKTENLSKGRLKLAIFKSKLDNQTQDGQSDIGEIIAEIDKIDEQYEAALDGALYNSVNEEISINN